MIARLPTTADGVPVLAGMTVYTNTGVPFEVMGLGKDHFVLGSYGGSPWRSDMDGYRWYSSLAACEAAKEQAKPRQ